MMKNVRVRTLMAYVLNGQTVCMEIRRSEVGDERYYWLEPTHRRVGEWTVKKAVAMGLLVPNGDALFPDLDSQTYKAAER